MIPKLRGTFQHRRFTTALFQLAVVLVAGAEAQAPPPPNVVAIEFSGLGRTSETLARELVGLEPGQPADPVVLDAAVARLLRTGRFLAADYSTAPAEGGVTVAFTLRERPVVTAIRLEGNTEYRESRLLNEIDQKVGEPFDLFAARDAVESITAQYREDGFSGVSVSFDENRVAETGELVFRIDEGRKVRVVEIRFEGQQILDEKQLRKQIETKTALWFFRKGVFDIDVVEADVARLRSFVRDEGFLDGEAAFRTEVSPEGDLTLFFKITEGTRYTIERIDFRGHSALTENELRALISSGEGQVVKRPQVDRDGRAIQTRYGELGYINANVQPVRVFSEQPGLVRITFEIDEGEQFRVGRVAVRGNTRTQDKVARRALNLYPPDDLFNLTEARAAERRLLDTRIFSTARVQAVGNQPGVRDAVIEVTESPKAGDFLFGAGVTSNAGLVGSIVLDLHNFDLFDYPLTWDEFLKFRSFYGGGQRMRIELQPGNDLGRYRIDFTEPYLFDKPLRYDVSLYAFNRGRDTYDESRIGTTSSLGQRFERGWLRGWSGEIALRNEIVDIDDLELFTSSEVRDDEGSNLLTSVKGSLLLDRTDNRFIPSTGDRFRVSYEQFLGEHIFGKADVGYDWFTTLSVDRLDRKHVLTIRGDAGMILGDAPVFERYFAGGTGSMRGFAFRGIGERDGIDETNIGGDFLILLGSEYSYPLYGENLRGHVFLDTGTAGTGTYRSALGTGIRINLNFLGPLPIELNVAMPLTEGDDDDTQVFSFIVGGVFAGR